MKKQLALLLAVVMLFGMLPVRAAVSAAAPLLVATAEAAPPDTGTNYFHRPGTYYPFDYAALPNFPAARTDTGVLFDLESCRGKNVVIFFWTPSAKKPEDISMTATMFDRATQVLFVQMDDEGGKVPDLRTYLGAEEHDYLRASLPNWIELKESPMKRGSLCAQYAWDMGMGGGNTSFYMTFDRNLNRGTVVRNYDISFDSERTFHNAFDIPVARGVYELDASGFVKEPIVAGFRGESTFTYSIDDPSIASVSESGILSGKKVGLTTLRVGAKGAAGDFLATISVVPSTVTDVLLSPENPSAAPGTPISISCKTLPYKRAVMADSITFDTPGVLFNPKTQTITNPGLVTGKVTGTIHFGSMTKPYIIDYTPPKPLANGVTVKFKYFHKDTATDTTIFPIAISPQSVGYNDLNNRDKWTLVDPSTGKTPENVGTIAIWKVQKSKDGLEVVLSIARNCSLQKVTLLSPENGYSYDIAVNIEGRVPWKPTETPAPTPTPTATPKPTATPDPAATPVPTATPGGTAYLEGASVWAKNEVQSAKESGLTYDGILNNYQRNITRVEFCKLVVTYYKTSGGALPAVGASPFSDTSESDVLIANTLGIVNGVSPTTFAPNAEISREEIAVMTMRAFKLLDTPKVKNDLSKFSDYQKISPWAVESLAFFNQVEIIKGVSPTEIAPQKKATREQAISIIYRTYTIYESPLWYPSQA